MPECKSQKKQNKKTLVISKKIITEKKTKDVDNFEAANLNDGNPLSDLMGMK